MEIFFIIVSIIVGLTWSAVHTYKVKRENYARENSIALRTLKDINSRYSFHGVPSFDMTHNYDNRNYYATISPKDYLTYQLVFKHKEIKKAINDAAENSDKMQLYQKEITAACTLAKFNAASTQENLSWIDQILESYWLSKGFDQICSVEKTLFDKEKKKPVTTFRMTIYICLTNIQGKRLTYKSATFYARENTFFIIKIL